MTKKDAAKLLHDLEVAGVAHAIRLNKRPTPGLTMGGNVSIVKIDEAGAATAVKQPYEFAITAELIAEAEQMINSQRAQYREPKTTAVSLTGGEIPDAVWKYGNDVQK